jgi:hypothetical protein
MRPASLSQFYADAQGKELLGNGYKQLMGFLQELHVLWTGLPHPEREMVAVDL